MVSIWQQFFYVYMSISIFVIGVLEQFVQVESTPD